MVKIIANEIRVGNILEYRGGLWEILKIMHTQPGKGGAYIQAEMKEIIKNTKLNERFRSSAHVEKAILDEGEYQYLYSEHASIVLMNNQNYEQQSVKKSLLGKQSVYLQDAMLIKVLSYNEDVVRVNVPKYVTLSVTEAEAVIKGQTASASYKPATLENGTMVTVPPFIVVGDRVVINTEDDSYVEREQ